MKRYNQLIALSVIVYGVLAGSLVFWIQTIETQADTYYKVEINRVYSRLSGELDPDRRFRMQADQKQSADSLLASCQWIKAVEYLPAAQMEQEQQAESFYKEDNHWKSDIRPVFRDGQLQGMLRFDYIEAAYPLRTVLIIIEIGLGFVEIFLLSLLFYMKYKLLRPFRQLTSLPYELAQGHLKGIVKEEKNKYFGKFLWGIGQLKDSLETSRKRTLELEKEKKLLLLSLSHDIKTPLNSIKLYAKALQENLYEKEEKRQSALLQITRKAAEIEGYVEEIMKNSREDILDIQVIQGEFYLKELMEQVREAYGEKCAIRKMELEIGRYVNRLLKGDRNRTLEVFENIFENAFKYGDGRTIAVTFYEEDDCQLIRIFNTGTPVAENDFNHIFESFFRASNSKGQPGNGLGLYICREIMQKMGGSIFAERENEGMAFVLVLQY